MLSGLELLTGRTTDVPLHLKVGESTQSVEVAATSPVVQTTSSEVQTTVVVKTTSELPLNGRNPLQLVMVTPGAFLTDIGTQGNQQQNTGVSTNGLRALDNNYQLDGVLYMDRFFDGAPILPNPDALQEFTVKASNYGAADSGAGATVQLSTKSGTNQFHGSAYEFLRNDALDARNFFAKVTTPFKRNQFGGTFGGPHQQGQDLFLRVLPGHPDSAAAPTPPRLPSPPRPCGAGDFSGLNRTIVDPTTGRQFPGNIVPASRFDPISVKLLDIVPLPNVSNLQAAQTPNSDTKDDQFVLRMDPQHLPERPPDVPLLVRGVRLQPPHQRL